MSPPASSGSDSNAKNATIDEKKRKRLISNRESAKRSRLKKQKLLTDLINEKNQLEAIIRENTQMLGKAVERLEALQARNTVLTDEKDRLAERLAYLESVANCYQNVKMEVPRVPLMNQLPWQQVHAHANMFRPSANMFNF